MENFKIYISFKSAITFVFSLIMIFLLFKIKDFLLILFASFVIASSLFPVVDWMSKKMPRWVSVLILYLAGFIILATVFVPFTVVFTDQTRELIKQMPVYWADMETIMAKLQIFAQNSSFLPDISQFFTTSGNWGQNIINQSISLTINFFTGLVAVFTMAVIILFMLLDKKELEQGILRFFPENVRERAEMTIYEIERKVGGYVRGQLLLMLLVSIITGTCLYLMGIQFAFLLGILAGLLEIIPIAGPILSAVPAIIIAFAHNPWLALWTVILYLIIQRIENSIMSPLILSRFLDMHPIIIIISLFTCVSLFGVAGAVLSPAIAAVVYVLIQELYKKPVEEK
jgi:predicted PurR-regulated permease PerM